MKMKEKLSNWIRNIADVFKKQSGGARLEQKEKKPRTRKEKIRLGIILALVILLALLLVGFAVYRSWAKPPDVGVPEVTPSPSVAPVVTDKPTEPSSGPDGEDEYDFLDELGPIMSGERKENFYTFLIIGRDTGGGGNTDTIMLGAFDVKNQKVNVMSIPRDTMVNVPWEIKRINSVYNIYGGGERGINALYNEVSQLVGFVPDFRIIVEWKAVGELVDAIGGVWFDVPINMDFWDPTQNLRIDIDKGYQLLDGDDAMGVVRWRQNNDGTMYPNGDIGRIETQQAFLRTVVAQCLQMKNVTRVKELAQVFMDNVTTDLTIGNLVWFAEQAVFGGLTTDNVNFITMPGKYNGTAWSPTFENYQSYVLPKGDEILKLVNECFNPYLEDCTLKQLDIMSVNPDGSLSSSTGYVEDRVAAYPPVFPTPEPEETEEPEPSEDPEVTPTPEVTDDPEPTPEVTDDPEPTPGATDDPEPTPSVTDDPEPTPSVTDDPEPTPSVNAEPEPTPEPDPEPAPSVESAE